jgi:pimeloyl-ACP methyl ester carboxylesterase
MNDSDIHVVAVPCFSGAPWDLRSFPKLAKKYHATTIKLPEASDSVAQHAEAVIAELQRHSNVVLVGDSFGALVSLEVALRRPQSLVALVLSGGFASDPNTSVIGRIRAWFAQALPRGWYDRVTLRAHASALASPHDAGAEVPWSARESRALFLRHTPWESYVGRLRAVRTADYRDRLIEIDVPTLILTPAFDNLVGPKATAELRDGIRGSEEVVLEGTGHMFRFTHPRKYEAAVAHFIETRVSIPDIHGSISDKVVNGIREGL